MKITIQNPSDTARNILRRAGYSEYVDRNTQKMSYSKRLGSDLFPKFHIYANESSDIITFDLHVDQKQVSYEGSSMHSGEYEGENIARELERIRSVAHANSGAYTNNTEQKKTGWFASIFGGNE